MTLTRSPGPGSGLDPLLERLQRGVDDDPLGLALQHAQHGNLDVHRQSIGDEGVGAAGLKGVGPIHRLEHLCADQVEFTLDAGAIKDTYVLEYDWDVAEDGTGVVSWTLVSAQVLKAMNGSYTLEASGTDTLVTYRLSVDVKIPMLGMLKRKAERVIIDTALKALKKRVEA